MTKYKHNDHVDHIYSLTAFDNIWFSYIYFPCLWPLLSLNRYKLECTKAKWECSFVRTCACVSTCTGMHWCARLHPNNPASSQTHNTVGNELTSQRERVPTQQTMPRPGTAGNGISGGLQMCQLECERHVRYANEDEKPLAWHVRPIYPTAAAWHGDTRLVRDGLWSLFQFTL